MSEVEVAQPLLLVMALSRAELLALPLLSAVLELPPRSAVEWLPPLGGREGSPSRMTSGSGAASRVSPVFHGSGVSHDGQVSRASSAGAPQAGHLRAALTRGF